MLKKYNHQPGHTDLRDLQASVPVTQAEMDKLIEFVPNLTEAQRSHYYDVNTSQMHNQPGHSHLSGLQASAPVNQAEMYPSIGFTDLTEVGAGSSQYYDLNRSEQIYNQPEQNDLRALQASVPRVPVNQAGKYPSIGFNPNLTQAGAGPSHCYGLKRSHQTYHQPGQNDLHNDSLQASVPGVPVTQNSPLSKREAIQLWSTYKGVDIPWEKFPDDIMGLIRTNQKLENEDLGRVRSIIVHHVRQINDYAPTRIWREIAKTLCSTYSASFEEIDNDSVCLGPGYLGMMRRLIDFNNDLNRPHKTQEQKNHQDTKRVKLDNNLTAGNVNNAPDIVEGDVDPYAHIRKDLNNRIKVPEILKKYSFLKEGEEIIKHFNKLTVTNINLLETQIETRYDEIFTACSRGKLHAEIPETHDLEKLLEQICLYFKEDITTLLIHHNADTTTEELQSNPTIFPTIKIIDNEPPEYFVYIEGIQFHVAESLLKAFELYFADYFVFNICFPKKISCLLEFFQRYALKIHPLIGTRSRANTHDNFNMQVHKLITKVSKL
ncbi:hypothetical protein DMENIID0001_048980 [Sergentomyia squamirostris]